MTNLRSLSGLFKVAMKLAAACAFVSAIAAVAAGQTNTFPDNGNAGVGTTTPAYPLTIQSAPSADPFVQGYFKSTSTSFPYGGVAVDGNSQSHIRFMLGGTLKWQWRVGAGTAVDDSRAYNWTLGADVMTLKNNGNVGIGNTNPGNYRLNVSGPFQGAAGYTSYIADGLFGATAVPSRISTYNFNGGILFGYEDLGLGDYSPRVGFQQTNHATYSPNITSTQASIGLVRNGNITIKGGASNTEFLRIDNSGNVGIGVSPNYKLDVNGELNATGLRINGTPISVSGAQWTGSSSIYYNGGNVGIGATTPGAKLDIGVGAAARGSFSDVLIGTGGNNAQMEFYGPTKSSAITHDETLGGLVLYTNGPSFSPSMFLANGGNVGIGTASPGAKLEVDGSGLIRVTEGTRAVPPSGAGLELSANSTGSFVGAYNRSTASYRRLYFYGSPYVFEGGNVGIGVENPQNKLHVGGSVTVDGNINAKYQDLAEWVPSSEQLSAATVVVLDTTKSNQVIASAQAYDTRVAGVISAQPGITLGESGEGKVLVATTGRVRVKVDASRGAIHIGDLLVTSDVPGVAMKSEPVEFAGRKMHMPGTIIGKALEPLAKGLGEILVLLSLQ